MKQFRNLAALILLPVCLVIAVATFNGCAAAYKATAVTTTTINTALDGWQGWIDAGRATVTQRQQVLAAVTKYRDALVTAQTATAAYFAAADSGAKFPQAAIDAVSAASGDLVTLVESFTSTSTATKGK